MGVVPKRNETRRGGGSMRPGGRRDRGGAEERVWLFGVHAVRDALRNPARAKYRLILTPNALQRLEDVVAAGGLKPEISDPRAFSAPLDPNSVHQGAALECAPLDWGDLDAVCAPTSPADAPRVLLLDRVTDPHNVGAILRSASVFGAAAVIAPRRHAAPETGALAKAASGALERQPYLRVQNLGKAMSALQAVGYVLIGLDGEAPLTLDQAGAAAADAPLGLVLGAEGAGLRPSTKQGCDALARIPGDAAFLSLNVSNAAAVALYETRRRGG